MTRKKGAKNKKPAFAWKQAHIDFLRKHYPDMSRVDLQSAFNKYFVVDVSDGAIKGVLARNKIKSGRTGRIEKGAEPWNKGLNFWKSEKYKASFERVKKSHFKKGSLPHNTAEGDGALSIRNDYGRPYYHIRISLGHWEYLHRVIWEQAHGEIPEEMVVIFKDGDSLNCELDNLELISRSDLVKRNANHYTDKIIARNLVGGKNAKQEDIDLMLQYPELLEAKRQTYFINKKLKQNDE